MAAQEKVNALPVAHIWDTWQEWAKTTLRRHDGSVLGEHDDTGLQPPDA